MKNFNEIYEKIYKNNIRMMEDIEVKKKEVKKMNFLSKVAFNAIIASYILLICSMFAHIIVPFEFLMEVAWGGVVGIIVSTISCYVLSLKSIKMDKIDKQLNVENIKLFIKEIDSNLTYIHNKGIPSNIYDEGESILFKYNRFYSEDYIEGTLNNKKILMSDVRTERDGRKKTIVDQEFFTKVDLDKNINSTIRIRPSLFTDTRGSIETDSGEFEKKFNVYSEDKIAIMQILTSDVMQEIIEFVEKTEEAPKLTIKENSIYIMFDIGDAFSPTITNGSFDYKTLKKYYDIFNFIDIITDKILKNIEDAGIQ